MRFFGVALLLLTVVFGAWGSMAHAQAVDANASAIKIQPALFEQVVNPGDRFQTSLTISNPDPVSKEFTASIEDISDITETGKPVFSGANDDYGLSAWVTISVPTFSVPAHGSVVIPFTIAVPAGAAPGGHYGAIFVTEGAKRPAFTGTGIGYQVGSLIDLRIAGDANESADVREFSTEKLLYQSPSVTFTSLVANTGNVLLRPRGPIDITNMFGQKVGSILMNNDNAAVFPGTQRTFTAAWNGKVV